MSNYLVQVDDISDKLIFGPLLAATLLTDKHDLLSKDNLSLDFAFSGDLFMLTHIDWAG